VTGETPAVRAEQALLGAILLDEQTRASDPEKAKNSARLLDEVVRWVMPGDFLRPYHQQVWSAVRALRGRRELATPEAVRAELGRSAQLRPETAQDGLLLHQLTSATPVVSRAPLYGGMVVEAALHREMHAEAVRLEQAAREGDPAGLVSAQAHSRTRVGILRNRWERVPDGVRARLDRPATFEAARPSRAEAAEQARRLAAQAAQIQAKAAEQIRAAQRAGRAGAADLSVAEMLAEMLRRLVSVVDYLANASIDSPRQAPTHGRVALAPGQSLAGGGKWNAAFVSAEADALTRDQPAQAEDEQDREGPDPARVALEGRLIGCLLADQSQVDDLALTGDEFTDPSAKAMYAAVTEIHRAGGAVDELTVQWAAQRAGADLTELNPEFRQAINDGLLVGSAPVYAGELVEVATREQATKAAEQLRQASADPRVTPARMLAEAEVTLAGLPEPKVRHQQQAAGPQPGRPVERQAEHSQERRQPQSRPQRRAEPQRVPELHARRRRRRQAEREAEAELEF
jgi:replicative DNA helicase